jgi:meso-butanediol dehydrogenase / (S,S)-butanediol dehydrogenase / diacetyl reductase
MRFEGKIAIVTGGTSGIGLAAGERLLAENSTVVLADVHEPNGPAADRLRREPRASFVHCDVTDASAVDRLAEQVFARYGRIDILVAAAGVAHVGTVIETGDDAWNRVMAVDLTGVFLCCRAVARLMRCQQAGAIVIVASEEGLVGGTRSAAYCAAKGGVIQLTRAMAVDHASDGLRVNCVCPGPVQTPLLQAFFDRSEDPERARRMAAQSTLLGRIGQPEEIASLIAFAASDEASYLTGSVLVADGGVTAR